MQTELILKIRDYTKEIPYIAEPRTDGSMNHGFKNLKGNPEEAAAIPEAQDNENLKSALIRINELRTMFFTIGCVKKIDRGENNLFWMSGYIEFAINHLRLAADAQSYFSLFFDFHHYIIDHNFDMPVLYTWTLEGAVFREVDGVGFSAAVWIATQRHRTSDEAQAVWGKAVDLLTDHLVSYRRDPSPVIYTAQTA